jgi:hypothetical protein
MSRSSDGLLEDAGVVLAQVRTRPDRERCARACTAASWRASNSDWVTMSPFTLATTRFDDLGAGGGGEGEDAGAQEGGDAKTDENR